MLNASIIGRPQLDDHWVLIYGSVRLSNLDIDDSLCGSTFWDHEALYTRCRRQFVRFHILGP